MARSRNLTPSYLQHKQSGRGRLVWTDSLGVRHERLLPGAFGSPESLTAKKPVSNSELAASATTSPTPTSDVSIAELLLAYLEHAKQHYRRDDGTHTPRVGRIQTRDSPRPRTVRRDARRELRPVKALKSRSPEVHRGEVVPEDSQPAYRSRFKRMIKWAVAEELIPPSVHQALAAVGGLQRGRTVARETGPVEPVDDVAGRHHTSRISTATSPSRTGRTTATADGMPSG